jgi:hypothetical protein
MQPKNIICESFTIHKRKHTAEQMLLIISHWAFHIPSRVTAYYFSLNILGHDYILKFVICGTRHCARGEVVVGMAEVYSFCNIRNGIHPPSDDTDSHLCLFVIVAQGLPLFY